MLTNESQKPTGKKKTAGPEAGVEETEKDQAVAEIAWLQGIARAAKQSQETAAAAKKRWKHSRI
jgi:hypothetical protein